MHYALTFGLSHFCCRVRTDSLPFEYDVRRSLRRTLPDKVQAPQMAIVIPFDSSDGCLLGRAKSCASPSARAVGNAAGQLDGAGGASCRWMALKGCRHDALRRGDPVRSPVAPVHAVVAVSVRMQCSVQSASSGSQL